MDSSERIKNIHLWGIKAAIFLIPVLPLYVSASMIFPYITGKNFAFRILVEFAAALWLPLLLINKEYRPRNSAITLTILTFTFIVGLADILGVSPYNSFWSNYERMEGYITVLHLVLYFMILRSILRTKRDWDIFFSLCLIASMFVAALAFIVTIDETTLSFRRFAMEYGKRPYSTIGNPPFLASYLLLSIFIGLILFIKTQKSYLRLGCLASILFNVGVIYYTGGRGVILTLAAGALLGMFIFLKGRNISRKSWGLVLFICILLIVSGLIFAYRQSDFLKHDRTVSRFVSMFSDTSVMSRFDAWRMALNGIRERPILGWGQENFIGVYTVNPIQYGNEQIWMDRAHNIVIDWLISAGFLGFFSYIAIFISAFYIIWTAWNKQKIKKSEAVVIVTALFAYFIQNLFTFDTLSTYFIFFALLAYIDNYASEENLSYPGLKNNIYPGRADICYVIAVLAGIVCFSLLSYYINYKPMMQNLKAIEINLSAEQHNSYATLLDDYNKTLSYNTFGNADVRERMVYIATKILSFQLFDQEGALKFVQATAEELGRGIEVNGHDLRYLTTVINFISNIARYDKSYIAKAETIIKECMRITPEYHWLYMALADVFKLKKDYNGSLDYVKKIVEWDPQNDNKQFELALAAIYASRGNMANSLLENIKHIRMTTNINIASGRESVLTAEELYKLAAAYRETGNYQAAIEYFKKLLIVLSYDDELYLRRDFRLRKPARKAAVHLELAKIYLILDDKNNAAKEAEKARALESVNFRGE